MGGRSLSYLIGTLKADFFDLYGIHLFMIDASIYIIAYDVVPSLYSLARPFVYGCWPRSYFVISSCLVKLSLVNPDQVV